MKRIYLIDCPGVVPPSKNDSPEDILLRGVVRVENVENPEQYIAAVLEKTKSSHIERTYDVRGFDNATEFLELLARKGGRLFKGGEADVDGAAKMVLNDFLRGKLPWFTPPPATEGGKEERGIDGRQGALGEMGRIGKPQNEDLTDADGGLDIGALHKVTGEDGGDTFEGFDDGALDESMDDSEGEQSEVEREEPIRSSIDEGGVAIEAG